MAEVGIRAIKQNASEVVARAAAGEEITVTDRGRPVAVLGPLPAGRLATLLATGRARPARRTPASLGVPPTAAPAPTPSLSAHLAATRAQERA